MSGEGSDDPEGDIGLASGRKQRRCLMCRTDFISEGPGERVCQRCKSRPLWRTGAGWQSDGGTT